MSEFLSWAEWLEMVRASDREDLKRLVREMEQNKLAAKRELRDAYRADLAKMLDGEDEEAADNGEEPTSDSEPLADEDEELEEEELAV